MEEFLPGLVRVMEERLGPFGRPLSTMLVLVITAGVMTLGIDYIVRTAVMPTLSWLGLPEGTTIERVAPLLFGIAIAVVGVAAMPLARRHERRKMLRRREAEDQQVAEMEEHFIQSIREQLGDDPISNSLQTALRIGAGLHHAVREPPDKS